MNIEDLKKLCEEQHAALKANRIFHTPITKRILTNFGDWDEYQQDAISRTKDCITKAAALGINP